MGHAIEETVRALAESWPQEITGRAEVIDESGHRKRYLEVRAELSPKDRASMASLNDRLEEVLHLLVKHGDGDAVIIEQLSAQRRTRIVHKGPQGELADSAYVVGQVREAIAVLRREGFKITHEATATQTGIPSRTLKRTCKWHGLAWWPWPPNWL